LIDFDISEDEISNIQIDYNPSNDSHFDHDVNNLPNKNQKSPSYQSRIRELYDTILSKKN
jgi:hypothetical protein